MNEFEKIQELLLEKERNQQKWNLEQDHKNKDLLRKDTDHRQIIKTLG